MGIFSKLFGKKEKESVPGYEGLAQGEKAPEGWGMPELGQPPQPGQQPPQHQQAFEEPSLAPSMQQQPEMRPTAPMVNPQMEVINSKLDAIRAMLNSVEMRLANLEKIARGDEDQKRYY
ncbi:hypothetical protein ACFLZB_00825 [Nanoarchaeota archaeon]